MQSVWIERAWNAWHYMRAAKTATEFNYWKARCVIYVRHIIEG